MTHSIRRTSGLVMVALLSALSFLLMYFQIPLLPAVSFLKLDFSILPALVGLAFLGVKEAYLILGLRTALAFLLNNSGVVTWIGLPMNFVALALFMLGLALFWASKPDFKSYLFASVVGTLLLTLAMFVLNLVYAVPLYAQFANFDIAQTIGLSTYLFTMVIPFNLLQGLIFAVSAYMVLGALMPLLKNYDK